MSTHYLDPADVNNGKRNAFQMLKDIWWALRTLSGSILEAPIVRYGADGKRNGETTVAAEVGWARENVAAIKWRQAQQDAKLDKILAALEGGK